MMVEPADTPNTLPLASTVAMPVLPEIHVPPLPVVVKVVLLPTHTLAVPDSVPGLGAGYTPTAIVAAKVPQLLVTV